MESCHGIRLCALCPLYGLHMAVGTVCKTTEISLFKIHQLSSTTCNISVALLRHRVGAGSFCTLSTFKLLFFLWTYYCKVGMKYYFRLKDEEQKAQSHGATRLKSCNWESLLLRSRKDMSILRSSPTDLLVSLQRVVLPIFL